LDIARSTLNSKRALAPARGVQPVQPEAVGEAIARAVADGRGVDVYVPGYIGAINTTMTIVPRRVRDAIRRTMRADDVLMNVDRSARAGYDSRGGPTGADHAPATPASEAGPE
jgi:hypothetical protein